MKSKTRLYGSFTAAVVVFAVLWSVLPPGFAHGVLLGLFGGVGSLMVAFLVFARVMQKRAIGKLKPPPLPTRSWDYTLDATTPEGQLVDFSSWSGDVLVLNFWATWCAPCVAEIPSLERLQAETADLGVRFGLISPEDAETVRAFLDRKPIKLPVYLLTGDKPECFEYRSIPATYVVDKHGMIALRHFGAAAWDAPPIVNFIRGLAAAPGD